MKKRIALEDEKDWIFDLAEQTVYYNEIKDYPQVQALSVLQLDEGEFGLDFELSDISLPNLSQIMMLKTSNNGALKIPAGLIANLSPESYFNVKELIIADFNSTVEFQEWVSNCVNLESVEIEIPFNESLPFDLGNAMKMKRLRINALKIAQIPDFVFNCNQLETLQFYKCPEIREIGDEIKQLTNLKSYWHWNSDFKYVSPELFKLSKLDDLNLYATTYKNPHKELIDAIKQLKQKKPDFYNGFIERVHWLREIWEQA
jgi:hypothetical protein